MSTGHHLPPVKDVTVYAEETDISSGGAWVLNVEWRDEFVEITKPEKLTFDIEVFHTEKMIGVHNVSDFNLLGFLLSK